jgi:hypothetical protein
VINQIQLKGWTPKPIKRSPLEDKILEGKTSMFSSSEAVSSAVRYP